jgi:hypothetical protein
VGAAVQAINGRLGQAFATAVCAQAVLSLTYKQLLAYYARFVGVVEKRCVSLPGREMCATTASCATLSAAALIGERHRH